MDIRQAYEEHIRKALHALPQTALAEILRLITVVREKYLPQEGKAPPPRPAPRVTHEHTRTLVRTSDGNWAQDLIRDRDDRL